MSAANVKARSASQSHKKPASETPWTRKLWIYDLRTNKHFTLKTYTLKREDLREFVRLYNSANRHDRAHTWGEGLDSGSSAGMTPQGRWRDYGYEDLIARENGVSAEANLGVAEVKARSAGRSH